MLSSERVSFTESGSITTSTRGFDLLVGAAILFLAALVALGGVDAGWFHVSHRTNRVPAGVIEDALADVASRSWEEVASMQDPANAVARAQGGGRFRVDVAVSQAGTDLLEIQAVLVDRSGKELDRLVTYRRRAAVPR